MYEELLKHLSIRPVPYEPGEPQFWNDEHISKGMLETHLDPEDDLATRKPGFVQKSADWIACVADVSKRPRLLDLGCGPGIYAQMFAQRGFCVTGVDFSPRSIDYARKSAAAKNLNIEYVLMNYLDIEYDSCFDIATLIYCDFGVLNGQNRKQLLKKIRGALAAGGLLIFDVLSPKQYEGKNETTDWSYCGGGFWSEKPYACLYSFLRYDDCRVYCDRNVIVEEERIRRFNIWNHAFTGEEISSDLEDAGFGNIKLFADVAGSAFFEESNTICAVAQAL